MSLASLDGGCHKERPETLGKVCVSVWCFKDTYCNCRHVVHLKASYVYIFILSSCEYVCSIGSCNGAIEIGFLPLYMLHAGTRNMPLLSWIGQQITCVLIVHGERRSLQVLCTSVCAPMPSLGGSTAMLATCQHAHALPGTCADGALSAPRRRQQ